MYPFITPNTRDVKREADFQSAFTKWKRESRGEYPWLLCNAMFELKFKKNDKRLNYKSDLRPHQLPALLMAKRGEWIDWKLSDADQRVKFADCFQIKFDTAWLVILWYTPRKPKIIHFIDPRAIEKEMQTGSKSLTKERAEEIAEHSVQLT